MRTTLGRRGSALAGSAAAHPAISAMKQRSITTARDSGGWPGLSPPPRFAGVPSPELHQCRGFEDSAPATPECYTSLKCALMAAVADAEGFDRPGEGRLEHVKVLLRAYARDGDLRLHAQRRGPVALVLGEALDAGEGRAAGLAEAGAHRDRRLLLVAAVLLLVGLLLHLVDPGEGL